MTTFEKFGSRLYDADGIIEISPHYPLRAIEVKVYTKTNPLVAGSMDRAFQFFFRDYEELAFSFPGSNLLKFKPYIDELLVEFVTREI